MQPIHPSPDSFPYYNTQTCCSGKLFFKDTRSFPEMPAFHKHPHFGSRAVRSLCGRRSLQMLSTFSAVTGTKGKYSV